MINLLLNREMIKINTLIVNQVLKEELTYQLLTKYSVTQFCNAMGVTRSVFYSTYIDMPAMFSDVIQYNIRQHFRDYRHYNTDQIIYAFLKHIDQIRFFYTNIYHLASKNGSRHICEEISNAFFKEMQDHLFNSNYSNKHIKNFTSVLFSHVTDWLVHDHEKDALDIYNEVKFMLPNKG